MAAPIPGQIVLTVHFGSVQERYCWCGWNLSGREFACELRATGITKTSLHVQRRYPRRIPRTTAM